MQQNIKERNIALSIFAVLSLLVTIANMVILKVNYIYLTLGATTIYELIAVVPLTIVLCMRRRKLALLCTVELVFASELNYFINMCYNTFWNGFDVSVRELIMLGMEIIPLINWIFLLRFALQQHRDGEKDTLSIVRNIWFIPGILSIVYASYCVYRRNYYSYMPLSQIPMIFLLGWWLTHPYKKVAPVQVPRISVQPATMRASMPQPFCSVCGTELPSDAMFCSVCGTKRVVPAQNAQPAYQQPAYRQGAQQYTVAQPADAYQPDYAQYGYQQPNYMPDDQPSSGMNLLGFFFPGVGLILYLVWRNQYPIKAKAIGKKSIIGAIVWVSLSILFTILGAVIPMLILGSY